MRFVKVLISLALASSVLTAHAQAPIGDGSLAIATEPGRAVAVATVEITATVTAIDPATRDVTLQTAAGDTRTVTAGPEVRNFDQIAVGDTVAVLYSEALELRLLKGQQAPVELTDSMGGARAEQGEKPAGAIGREVRVVGNVIAVDAATQTITLQGPERTVELALQDPEQFKLVEVGDQVEATYVQLLALAVEPQP